MTLSNLKERLIWTLFFVKYFFVFYLFVYERVIVYYGKINIFFGQKSVEIGKSPPI